MSDETTDIQNSMYGGGESSSPASFGSLFSTIGGWGSDIVNTAVPLVKQDVATRLQNSGDLRALEARISNGNGNAGSNPNDLRNAAQEATQGSGKFALMPYIYSSGKMGVMGWVLIAAIGFFGVRWLLKLTK